MIAPRRSIPLDHEAPQGPRDISGDWPQFAEERGFPGVWFWLVMLAGGLVSAAGLGWLILAVLA